MTRFAHRPSPDFGPWRDEQIIPRYNGAGISKFAFLVPAGAGTSEPAPEGPATIPTGYFESRDEVYEWFGRS